MGLNQKPNVGLIFWYDYVPYVSYNLHTKFDALIISNEQENSNPNFWVCKFTVFFQRLCDHFPIDLHVHRVYVFASISSMP